MAYRLNKKNLAVSRVMAVGKNANPRLQYIHASRNGTTATDGYAVARVSLTSIDDQPVTAAIYPKKVIDKSNLTFNYEPVLMNDAHKAETTSEFAVPDMDALIPSTDTQVEEFTCNAEQLLKLLKVVMDVSEDSDHCVRMRICESPRLGRVLRIDSLTFPGQQSFCGVLKGIQYAGNNIAGGAGDDSQVPDADETVKQTPLPLKLESGRKFRG